MLTMPAEGELHCCTKGRWGHLYAGLELNGEETISLKICIMGQLILRAMFCSSGTKRMMVLKCWAIS